MSDSPNDEQMHTNAPLGGDPVPASEPTSSTDSTDPAVIEHDFPVVHPSDDGVVAMAPSELKANQLSSVDDLVRFAYQQGGKRLSLPGAVVRRISADAKLDDDAAEPLFTLVDELVETDRMLAVPPRVLAFAASAKPAIHLRRRLENAMATALRRHPMFDVRRLRDVLDSSPEDFDSVLDGLREAAKRMTPERLGVDAESLKPSQRNKLYVNATLSLTLLLALRDGWPEERVADVLYRRLWRDSVDPVDRLAAIGAMADARDGAALAVLGRVLDRQRRDAERLAHDAQSDAERAFQRAMTADAEVVERDDKIRILEQRSDDLVREIDALRESLTAAERSRVHDRSHHVDDYEALRTRIVRVLDKQVELLSDGLHAFREGASEVTEEFTDRTIAALNRELAQLRGQGERNDRRI